MQLYYALAMQDFSQLKKDYGRERADVIVNITGNIISGQVMGETSKLLSERFEKIMQDRQSVSINRTDTSISHSKQLDAAIPAGKIAALSSGEFVGMVADDPLEKTKLKMFHSEIINVHEKLNAEVSNYRDIPVISNVTQQQVLDNYCQVKMDIKKLIREEAGRFKAEKA
jgi:TraM recognition site of TraD and TraG